MLFILIFKFIGYQKLYAMNDIQSSFGTVTFYTSLSVFEKINDGKEQQ